MTSSLSSGSVSTQHNAEILTACPVSALLLLLIGKTRPTVSQDGGIPCTPVAGLKWTPGKQSLAEFAFVLATSAGIFFLLLKDALPLRPTKKEGGGGEKKTTLCRKV